jgi:hypothetical protein
MVGLFLVMQWFLGLFARVDHSYGNVRWYLDVARKMHGGGFFNVWTPYPPVFPILLYLTTSILMAYSGFLLFWQSLNVALVAGVALCIYKMLFTRDRHRALLAATGYVLINATWNSRLTIGLFVDQFEYIPIFLVMLSMYLLMRNRLVWSAVVAGIGAMTKLFPAVILLLALFSLERKHKIRYTAVFALTCIVIISPYLIGGTQPLRSWFEFSAARGGWETIWTYPQIKFPPIPNPRQLTVPFTSDARPYGWLAWLTAASMLAYLWWQRRTASRMLFARKTLCLLLLLLIFSKGVSSYFIFWIFPLLFVCYRPMLAFIVCVVFMLVANIEFFVDTYWISIWTRHAIFVALFVHQALHSQKDDMGELPAGIA